MLKSPQIKTLSWGKIILENGESYKDAKLFPGGSKDWNWNETGTSHSTGIQYSDVRELIDKGAEEIILTKGILGRLKVQDKTIERLESEGIVVHVLETKKAVKVYNNLIRNKKVGALIHSTC